MTITAGDTALRAKVARYRYLKSFQFDCNGLCAHLPLAQQGQPHAGMPHKHARSTQLARTEPDVKMPDWRVWVVQAGRGWGKTQVGAKWIAGQALKYPGTDWAIIAPKFADARDTCIEGSSGLRRAVPEDRIKRYNRSNYTMFFTNGSRIYCYGAEDKDVGPRGKNLAGAWVDEAGFFPHPEVWTEQLLPAVRNQSLPPKILVTTTPRPTELMRHILAEPGVHVTRGATYENALNLSPAFLAVMHDLYDGTRIGRQEIEGELLEDVIGALWTQEQMDLCHDERRPMHFRSIVVAVDPAGSTSLTSDLTGIVVAGIAPNPHTNRDEVWVLADHSGRYSPDEWATRAVMLYDEWKADAIVAETNFGAQMVESTVRHVDQWANFQEVHASRGKAIRAAPVQALYEQRRVKHVKLFKELEDQMTHWVPGLSKDSPDRLDAMVWAVTALTEGADRYIENVSDGTEESTPLELGGYGQYEDEEDYA